MTKKKNSGLEQDQDSLSDNDDQQQASSEQGGSEQRPKLQKKKAAIILGYKGTHYQGMQINPNAITIETFLFKALCSAGLVSEANSVDQKKVSFMRSCRTDKGVHAAMQVVSLKILLPSPPQTLDSAILKLNQELPADIRVFGIQRLSSSFQARTKCDSRVYEYLLPTYVLESLDRDFISKFFQQKDLSVNQIENEKDLSENEKDLSENTSSPSTTIQKDISPPSQKDLDHMEAFRIPQSTLQNISNLLNQYQGTHSFHNYTVGKLSTDPSCKRYIKSFTISEPFVVPFQKPDVEQQKQHSGFSLEWIKFTVHGQSFMLHQIRKFIAMVILICKFRASIECIKASLSPLNKFNIPKAPGFGLLLDQPFFEGYNKRFPTQVPLNKLPYQSLVEDFKEQQIYPQIFQEEFNSHQFYQWTESLLKNSSEFTYLKDFDSLDTLP